MMGFDMVGALKVSTHSRLKAAGHTAVFFRPHFKPGFNTQPPEGGWHQRQIDTRHRKSFNTQPPEGGWRQRGADVAKISVSTHSRLKAAGTVRLAIYAICWFQHTAA